LETETERASFGWRNRNAAPSKSHWKLFQEIQSDPKQRGFRAFLTNCGALALSPKVILKASHKGAAASHKGFTKELEQFTKETKPALKAFKIFRRALRRSQKPVPKQDFTIALLQEKFSKTPMKQG
jgi:hypothetical protein